MSLSGRIESLRYYEYRHVLCFDETNVVGNAYYAHHIRWQGHCRELFLREHVPELLDQLGDSLVLVTLRCSCEYFAELMAFDEVALQMRVSSLGRNRIGLSFDYVRTLPAPTVVVARGEQEVACMVRRGGHLIPAAIPASLRAAIGPYWVSLASEDALT